MRLRPHHLLCTQGYSGRGYDDDFVENMSVITGHLRNDVNACIDIVFSTDDICEKCPNMISANLCKDNDKVERFDRKVIEYFGLEEKRYVYHVIISKINAQMTASMMDDICSGCSWYPVSDCKKNILEYEQSL